MFLLIVLSNIIFLLFNLRFFTPPMNTLTFPLTKEIWPKIYLGQDPELEPDVFKSRIQIRSKIAKIRNTGNENWLFLFCSSERPRRSCLFIVIKSFLLLWLSGYWRILVQMPSALFKAIGALYCIKM
jgi:hypothetical protein